MTWRDRAACWGQEPELFFPDGNTAPALLQTEKVAMAPSVARAETRRSIDA